LFAGSVIAAGISAGSAVATVSAFIRLKLVVFVPYATIILQFVAHLWCRAGGAGVDALGWAEEVSASGFGWKMRSAGVAGCAARYGSRTNPL
jgi:hypothetical protein